MVGVHGEVENLVDCLWNDLSNGVMELRASVYGLISSLSNRIWFAEEICKHESLFGRLIDTKSEVHAELSKCRYAVDDPADSRHLTHRYGCVVSLAATARSVAERQTPGIVSQWDSLRLKEETLHNAVEQGPFGRGVGAPTSVPIVGTELR